MTNFYDNHWSIEGAYDNAASDEFQIQIFRKMFPGFEKNVQKQVKEGDSILDIGCGPAVAAQAYFGDTLKRAKYIGIDRSEVALEKARKRLGGGQKVKLLLGDAFASIDVYKFGEFDFISCFGVLHYQEDMRKSVKHLAEKLKIGGRFIAWIYKEQNPIRKLTDDYLRSIVSKLPKDKVLEVIKPLTELGMELGQVHDEIHIERDIPCLGIETGIYSVHELFYYYFIKLFYNPTLPFERHVVNNLNAFGPEHVLFLPENEILAIFVESGFDIETWSSRGNGVGIVAVKTGMTEAQAMELKY